MRKQLLMCLVFLAFTSSLYAQSDEKSEVIVIANNSAIDFSSLPNLAEQPFVIIDASFESMNNGETMLLLSDKKWTDEQMADYKLKHENLPLVLTIAAFSDEKDASPELQAEVFSGRAGAKILYLYITESIENTATEDLALHFSETTQAWFDASNLMKIPVIIQQQNRVELGLLEPQFAGGYK